jgi:hypothetical protein
MGNSHLRVGRRYPGSVRFSRFPRYTASEGRYSGGGLVSDVPNSTNPTSLTIAELRRFHAPVSRATLSGDRLGFGPKG